MKLMAFQEKELELFVQFVNKNVTASNSFFGFMALMLNYATITKLVCSLQLVKTDMTGL